MNRRDFLTQTLLATSGLVLAGQVVAMPFAFEEGTHYKLLPDTAQAPTVKGSVQEFFFYGCSHCMDMEPHVKTWLAKKPAMLTFEQLPAVFQSPAWTFLARTHYALKHANQFTEQTHHACFELFIVDKAKPKNQQELAEMIAKKVSGFDQAAFVAAFQSDDTSNAVARAAQLSGVHQLDSVPGFVINGKYLTDLTMAGSHTKLFALIEQLAAK